MYGPFLDMLIKTNFALCSIHVTRKSCLFAQIQLITRYIGYTVPGNLSPPNMTHNSVAIYS